MHENSHTEKFAEGKTIFTIGDPGGDLIVIKSGRIGIYKLNEYGKEIEIAQMGPGEILGAMTLFSAEARTATARALELSELTRVPRPQVDKLINSCPVWVKLVTKDLIARVNIANKKYVEAVKGQEQSESSVISKVKIACQIARGLKLYQESTQADGAEINIKKALNSIRAVLCYHHSIITDVTSAFEKAGFFPVGKSSADTISKSEILEIGKFADFVNEIKQDKSLQKRGKLTSRERKQLWAFLEFVEKIGSPPEKEVTLPFNQLETTMESAVGRAFDPLTIEVAKQCSMLQIHEDQEGKAVILVPNKFRLLVQSAELYVLLSRGQIQASMVA